jgi:hypothetical protein
MSGSYEHCKFYPTVSFCCTVSLIQSITENVPYFSIDDAHQVYNAYPNIFITPFDVLITCIHQLVVELVNTQREWRNSLKAHTSLVVILVTLSLIKNFLDLNSLMLNKY